MQEPEHTRYPPPQPNKKINNTDNSNYLLSVPAISNGFVLIVFKSDVL